MSSVAVVQTPKDENSKKIDELKKDLFEKAENIVYKTFPATITRLQELQKSELWQLRNYDEIVAKLPPLESSESNGKMNGISADGDTIKSPPAKRGRSSSAVESNKNPVVSYSTAVPSNSHVLKVAQLLKPILREFIDNCTVIKVWISLLVPKMEDGNNFGVSIQAEVVKEVTYYEDDANKFYDELIEHFTNRAKLCSKIIKYPNIEDYRNAIREMDERQFGYLTRFVTAQILHSHALVHDLISKNYEKIKRPRGANSSSLTMY